MMTADMPSAWSRFGISNHILISLGMGGHSPFIAIAAVEKQLRAFSHLSITGCVPYENYIALAERLNEITPGDFKDHLCHHRCQAVRTANQELLQPPATCGHCQRWRRHHGAGPPHRTDPDRQVDIKGFGAMMPMSFTCRSRSIYTASPTGQSLGALTKLFKTDLDPGGGCVIIEPVQRWVYQAPYDLMRGLRALCT
jgi:4-aminobutyrate aminotransferase